jgi:hypothetical protein
MRWSNDLGRSQDQRDDGRRTRVTRWAPFPCLLVSLSPCLLVSLSPCLLVSLSPCLSIRPVGTVAPWPVPPVLIIRQTPEVHDELRGLLRVLRR